MKGLSREVALFCPTCGGAQFSSEETHEDGCLDEVIFICANCNRSLTKDELVELNSEVISVNADEIAEEAVAEIQKELGKMLKKAFG